MTARVERIGDRFSLRVTLTVDEVEALSLVENEVVEAKVVDGKLLIAPAGKLPRHIESYRRTRGEHEGVYTELAK